MAKLVKSKEEWEGTVFEQNSVVEDNEPIAWAVGIPLKIVGKGHPRIDGTHRVTGQAKYTSDIQLPGMLYTRVLRSPHPCPH